MEALSHRTPVAPTTEMSPPVIGDPAKSATCRTGWSVELELSLVILARSVSLGRRAPPSRRC